MFRILETPIEEIQLKTDFINPQAGAFVTFEGWVRNVNEGKSVLALEYEAYPELALTEAEKIIQEAKAQFEILDALCVHRVGRLAIGEMAVWVGVNAQHRGAAFEACQYIIDEVKHRLPIWKKEFYSDGDSGWVNCQQCSEAGHAHSPKTPLFTESQLYSRQEILKEVGPSGQAMINNSKVLVVGAGGLGSPALMYLAAAGIGTLGICEADTLEASNLHRQVLYSWKDVGQPKLDGALHRLRAQNPFVQINAYPQKLTSANVEELFQQYDLVLDCTDNFTAKFLMNDAAVLTGTPLIQASIYQYEGQLLLIDGQSSSPCLRCLWPETPLAGCVGTCADVGVLGAVPGVFGAIQALEGIKLLLGIPERLTADTMLVMDLRDYEVQWLKRIKNPTCPACVGQRETAKLLAEDTDMNVTLSLLTPEELATFCLVDIREAFEREITPLPLPALPIPASQLTPEHPALPANTKYLLICQRGIRSQALAHQLREQGYKQFYSMNNGIAALSIGLTQNVL